VLYVADIAKILGKSDKAISNLMARKSLPFQVKTVGRARCVDVYQVAQWLSSDTSLADEVAGGPEPQPASRESQTRLLVSKPVRDRQTHGEGEGPSVQVTVPTVEPEFGPYAKSILERRQAEVKRLQGFAAGLQGIENMAFMCEVLDEMTFGSLITQMTYAVTFENLSRRERGLWADKSKLFFENEQSAAKFAHLRLKYLLSGRAMGGTQLKIEFNERVVFWCVLDMEAGLQVINNEMNLPLPELEF
jgi:hypothetical protein